MTSLKIDYYRDYMHSQVIDLFAIEYGTERSKISLAMSNLYDNELHKNRSIRLVALDGDKVIGFVSFFYWPYEKNGVLSRSYQCGNSIVHPGYRGKGIFNSLLNYFNSNQVAEIDFFIGFPVEASFRSFLKCNWISVIDLSWYVKMINPFSLFVGKKRMNRFFSKKKNEYFTNSQDYYSLSSDAAFRKWKSTLELSESEYYYYEYQISSDLMISFDLKFQRRKYFLKELIIGKVNFKGLSIGYLDDALVALLKTAKRSGAMSFCSIAINPYFSNGVFLEVLSKRGFFKINKNIHFIVKVNGSNQDVLEVGKWNVGRADIDTW